MNKMDSSTSTSREPQTLFFHWLQVSAERLVPIWTSMKELKLAS
jgi:hypothetical protein